MDLFIYFFGLWSICRSPKSPVSRKDRIIKFPEPNFAHFEDMQISNGEELHLNKYSQSASEDRQIRVGGKRSSRLEKQLSIPENRISVPELVFPELRGRQSPRGPRLFSEVFAMGCSVAYRWASVREFYTIFRIIVWILCNICNSKLLMGKMIHSQISEFGFASAELHHKLQSTKWIICFFGLEALKRRQCRVLCRPEAKT